VYSNNHQSITFKSPCIITAITVSSKTHKFCRYMIITVVNCYYSQQTIPLRNSRLAKQNIVSYVNFVTDDFNMYCSPSTVDDNSLQCLLLQKPDQLQWQQQAIQLLYLDFCARCSNCCYETSWEDMINRLSNTASSF
jgi:hypothetical protein